MSYRKNGIFKIFYKAAKSLRRSKAKPADLW